MVVAVTPQHLLVQNAEAKFTLVKKGLLAVGFPCETWKDSEAGMGRTYIACRLCGAEAYWTMLDIIGPLLVVQHKCGELRGFAIEDGASRLIELPDD